VIVFVLLPEADRTATRTHHYSHIECDVCGEHSPDSAVLVANHGLSHMGWFVGPGQHRCPKHYHDEVAPRGPQYRDQ